MATAEQPIPAMSLNGNPNFNAIVDPALAADILMWQEAKQQMAEDLQKLKAEAANCHSFTGAMMLMMGMTDGDGDKIATLAAVDNVQTDLRNIVTGAVQDFNDTSGNSMNDFRDKMNELEAFLKSPIAAQMIDPTDISNMTNSIDSIKSQFGGAWNIYDGSNDIGALRAQWAQQSQNGQFAPQVTSIQGSTQTMSQTTSSFSAATNAKLQYTEQEMTQYTGQAETSMQSMQKQESTMVQNLRSGG